MAEIIFSDVKKSFEQDRVILDGVSFQIDKSERAAILGDNGTGKTTLLRMITGELQPDSGYVSVPKARKVGYVAQLNTARSGDTVEDVLRQAYREVISIGQELDAMHADMAGVSANRYDELTRRFEALGGYDWQAELARIAAGLGIDLADVKAAHGRVLAEDLLRYIAETREKKADDAAGEREEVKPMNGMRKAIAKNMLASVQTSPTVTFNLGIDMTEMKRYREQLKAKEIKVSYTDLLVKFVAKALTEFPLLNCSVEDNKIIYKHYVNMGVAVALDSGLLVPNIQDADKKSLTQISAEVKEMAKQAREGKLPPEKLKGGTFTITNLGMYGIESFTPIINQPEVAILGVNTMEDKVVVRNGEMCIRPIMNLSLTADHRVVDGSVAAEFLQRVKSLMENPALILA